MLIQQGVDKIKVTLEIMHQFLEVATKINESFFLLQYILTVV